MPFTCYPLSLSSGGFAKSEYNSPPMELHSSHSVYNKSERLHKWNDITVTLFFNQIKNSRTGITSDEVYYLLDFD